MVSAGYQQAFSETEKCCHGKTQVDNKRRWSYSNKSFECRGFLST